MSANTLMAGDVVYVRATVIENYGPDMHVRVHAERISTTVMVAFDQCLLIKNEDGHDDQRAA